MKKIILSISVFVMLAFISCGPTSNDAVAYNDKIIDIVNKVTLVQNNFFDQMDGHNMDSLVITQKIYSERSKAELESINKLPAFAEKKEYLDAAINFVKSLNALADNEGKQIVEIMTKDTASITEADVKMVEDLAAKLDDESNKVTKAVEDAQQAFRTEWKFDIEHKH